MVGDKGSGSVRYRNGDPLPDCVDGHVGGKKENGDSKEEGSGIWLGDQRDRSSRIIRRTGSGSIAL